MNDHLRSTGVGSTKMTGSAHYKGLVIEPIEYIEANNLPFHEGEIVKYITRWRSKDGLKDLEKVEWYIHRLMELEQKKQEANLELRERISAARIGTLPKEVAQTPS